MSTPTEVERSADPNDSFASDGANTKGSSHDILPKSRRSGRIGSLTTNANANTSVGSSSGLPLPSPGFRIPTPGLQPLLLPDEAQKTPTTTQTIDQLQQNIRLRSLSLNEAPSDTANFPGVPKQRRKSSVSLRQAELEKPSFESELYEKGIERIPEEAPNLNDVPLERKGTSMDFNMISHHITDDVMEVLRKNPSSRSEEDISMLEKALKTLKAMDRYPDYVRKEVLKCGFYRRLQTGQILFKQGDPSENFYIIIEGSMGMLRPQLQQGQGPLMNMPNAAAIESRLAKLMKTKHENDPESRQPRKESIIDDFQAVFTSGDCFGEVGLVRNTPRSATLVCLEVSDILIVERTDYENILKVIQEREIEDRVAFLHSMPIFHSWPKSSLASLNSALIYQTVLPTRVVIRQNEEPEGMFFILSGECIVIKEIMMPHALIKPSTANHSSTGRPEHSRSHSPGPKQLHEDEKKVLHIGILVAGDYFGEIALLKGIKRTATVITSSVVELLFLPKNEFNRRITHRPLEFMKDACEKYPTDDELRKAYRNQRKWADYKQKVVQNVVSSKEGPK